MDDAERAAGTVCGMGTPALSDLEVLLRTHYGDEPWWWPVVLPELARPDELLLGAVLCQQTRWERVEQVLLRLAAAGLASWESLAAATPETLEPVLAGVAYPRARSVLLPRLARSVQEAGGMEEILASAEPRGALLALPQVGPETADTILTFTGHSTPIVDAYLRRVLGRLGIVDPEASYTSISTQLGEAEVGDWSSLHALLVEHGIHHCLARNPRCHARGTGRRAYHEDRKCASHCRDCTACPLASICPVGRGEISL